MVACSCQRRFEPKTLSGGSESQQIPRILEHLSVISNQRAKKFPEAANPRGGGGLKLLPGAIGQIGIVFRSVFERSSSTHDGTVNGISKQVNTFLNGKLTGKSSESTQVLKTNILMNKLRHKLPMINGLRSSLPISSQGFANWPASFFARG